MTESATNERQIERRKKASANSTNEDREAITLIMASGSGRAWMWRTLTHCQVFNDSNDVSHGVLAHEKGRRTAGLFLLQQITRFAPDMYVRMANENDRAKPIQQDEIDTDD